ncbi:MAG: energy transducer TonB [Myxococcota bacterium]|nr:energy transducer TonB [Myxococcota bacterium]
MKRVIFCIVSMFMGTSGVLGAILTMNLHSRPVEKEKVEAQTSFQVAKKKKKKKKKQRVRQQQRPKAKPRSTPKAPPPQIASNLSGVDFSALGVGDVDLGDASSNLLGGAESTKDLVMTEASVDSPPRRLESRAPKYPARARAKGIEGKVTLSLLIGTNGQVAKVRVLDAEPAGVFEDAAKDAVMAWRFDPATYRGQTVKIWAEQVVNFSLL